MVWLGVVAMVGALGIAVGDAFLLGNPVSGREFRRRRLDNLLHVPHGRMFVGHTLGILILPLTGCGIWQVFLALEPAGLEQALPPVLIMGYMMVMGAAAHGCFAFLGDALQLQRQAGETLGPELQGVVHRFRRLLLPLFAAFVIALVAGSLWFAVVVWTQTTLYPPWMAWFNPVVLYVVLGLLESLLPAPIGGFVRPANGNIAMFTFFLVSTVVLV